MPRATRWGCETRLVASTPHMWQCEPLTRQAAGARSETPTLSCPGPVVAARLVGPMDPPSAPPVVLIAGARVHSLTSALETNGYVVVQSPTAMLALAQARDVRPDVIILGVELPDISAIAGWLFDNDLHIGSNVPILVLAPDRPTPEQRVTALHAGAWDFLRYPGDPDELLVKLQTYVQAKRNLDATLAEGPVDAPTGVHSRASLARRARELGALMSRQNGALACIVFALEAEPADPRAGSVVARAARVSDVVGALGPTEFAIVAPATDHAGAVKLAQRIAAALSETLGGGVVAPGSTLRVGYDAVGNLKYSPLDPVALLLRATTALRSGRPEPGSPWVRRFDLTTTTDRGGGATGRTTPSGLAVDPGRASS